MSNQSMWRKSTRSANQNACVELAVGAERTGVRDSKAPDAGRLTFGNGEYKAFLSRMKANEVDHQS